MSELSARLDREQRRLTARKQDALRGSERVTKFAWRPLKSFGGGDRYDFVVSSEPTGTRIAIALMGVLVGAACVRGARTQGKSRLYRAMLAGLEAHVVTHIATSISFTSYTAGLITAPLVMLPGARAARAELRRGGSPLLRSDTARGGALLLASAMVSHVIARLVIEAGYPRVRIPRT